MCNLRPRMVWISLMLGPLLLFGQQEKAGNTENGKRLYVQKGCYECHGYVGQGGAAGPRIAPWSIGAEGLISYVRRPAGQMPPYTVKVMPDPELIDVSAYLKSIPAPRPANGAPVSGDSREK